ncbi:DgyrCDS1450 [Dimorphilus gyrociliatus]|uniref:Methylthioribose-1-phosphate isomerase n=1 Tax=Dimorphilus gyrociliatus TaxID=2664684 RepID=A0A7I8V7A4_9ANNE|nr:DgyrCDS1450 [Dimorphilus gyrociliatus]
MSLQSIVFDGTKLEIIDQLQLPNTTKYIDIKDTKDGHRAIKTMQIRGAPAIAVLGSLSLHVEMLRCEFASATDVKIFVEEKMTYLVSARPTAVNISEAKDRLVKLASESVSNSKSASEAKALILEATKNMLKEDVDTNKAVATHGAMHLLNTVGGEKVSVLTHCNTGSLATAGYGTALGVIRKLGEEGRLEHCYCTETRPYNQGARLTAYELTCENLPSSLICDDMVAYLMKEKKISAVFVGADRVVANGDTANKIGTYQIAICAKYHNIPFYVVTPRTTIDLSKKSGKEIIIEERPHSEMTKIGDCQIAPQGMNCWNPAFDVTPAELITGGIVTEIGVFHPNKLEQELRKS